MLRSTREVIALLQKQPLATHAQSLGANLFEASSFSPPYWMTNSGTSQGGVNGADNLASGYYGSGTGTFADYLTTVAQHFSSSFGITFHHLEALNYKRVLASHEKYGWYLQDRECLQRTTTGRLWLANWQWRQSGSVVGQRWR